MNNRKSSNVLSPLADRPKMHRATLAAMGAIALFAVGMNTSQADTPIAPSGLTAQPSTPPDIHHRMISGKMAKMRERRKAHVEHELDNMSNRLKITASEQPAWSQYKAARMGLTSDHDPILKHPTNAAEKAKIQADRASEKAEKMATLSTATSQLRAALVPDQQKALDKMSRNWREKMQNHHDKAQELNHS